MLCDFKTKNERLHVCKRCGFELHVSVPDISKVRRNCESKPGMIEKAKNFGKSMAKFAQNKFKTVSAEEQKRRAEICEGNETQPACEFFNNGTCDKCGCITILKAKIESEHCPEGKW